MARNFAREKRCLKRGMKIMLILCISFFVFTSCGIPSFFYMYDGSSGTSDSYYNFTDVTSTDGYVDSFELDFKVTYDDVVTSIEGPNLVYLYTIVSDDLSDGDMDDITEKFEDEFSSEYINSNSGRPISSSTEDVLTITYNDTSYSLNKFIIYDDENSSKLNEQVPKSYGLSFDGTVIDSTEYDTTFEFAYNSYSDNSISYFSLSLDQTDENNFKANGDTSSTSPYSYYLRKYDSTNFLVDYDGTSDGYGALDSEDENKAYTIIIYSALNVSEGDSFTNIFWGSLNEVARFSSSQS